MVWFTMRALLCQKAKPDEFVEVIREIRGTSELTAAIKAEMELADVGTMIKERLQVGEDERAQALVARINSNNQFDPYSVFLRAFTDDGRWTLLSNALMSIQTRKPKHFHGVVRGRMTIDSFLAQVTYTIAPLVAVSMRKRESLSRLAFMKVSDEEWQRAVLTLIDHSSCIFCLPGRHNGIVWEIQRIVERADRLQKTVFVLPPSPTKRFDFRARRERNNRVETKRLLKEKCGLPLPDLNNDGAFFVIGREEERFDYRIVCLFRETIEANALEQLIWHVSGVAGISAIDVPVVEVRESLLPPNM